MSKFKNISDNDLSVVGVGLIKSGETRNMPKGFHNANFKKVSDKKVDEKPKEEKIDKPKQ